MGSYEGTLKTLAALAGGRVQWAHGWHFVDDVLLSVLPSPLPPRATVLDAQILLLVIMLIAQQIIAYQELAPGGVVDLD